MARITVHEYNEKKTTTTALEQQQTTQHNTKHNTKKDLHGQVDEPANREPGNHRRVGACICVVELVQKTVRLLGRVKIGRGFEHLCQETIQDTRNELNERSGA